MDGLINPDSTCVLFKLKKGRYSTLWFEKYYRLFKDWYGCNDEE